MTSYLSWAGSLLARGGSTLAVPNPTSNAAYETGGPARAAASAGAPPSVAITSDSAVMARVRH